MEPTLEAGVPSGEIEGKIDAPSAELNLPTKKKKRGNCFSCAGGTDKEEPYKKRKGNAEFDFNRPDVDGSMEMKTGNKFDLSGTDPNLGGDIGRGNAGFDLNGPEVDGSMEMENNRRIHATGPDIKPPEVSIPTGNIDADASGPSVDISGTDSISTRRPKIGVAANAPDINAPDGKMTTEISDPEFDVSKRHIKIPDIFVPSGKTNMGVSGTSIDTDADFDVSRPDVEFDKHAPNIDTPEGKLKTQMSGPDVDVSTGHIKDPKVKLDRPSAELDMPSTKKKRGNCLSCTGSADKDEPYRKTRGDAEFGFHGPEVDGSTQMVKGGKFDVHGSDISMPSGKTNMGVSGTSIDTDADFDVSRPDVEFDKHAPNIDTPEGKLKTQMSGTDVDVSKGHMKDPNLKLDRPSAELDMPSTKKKRGNCLSCTGSADKDEPYRKTRGDAEFGFHGPEVDGSTQMVKGGKFDVHGSDISMPSGKTNMGVSGTSIDTDADFDVSRPDVKFDKNAPSIDTPEGKLKTQMSGTDVDVSKAHIKDPNLKLDCPSAELDMPSTKKKRGNCLSCTGGTDKDEPYRKTRGNAEFGLHGPEVDGSTQMVKGGKFNIHDSDPDMTVKGREHQEDFKLRATAPDVGGDVALPRPSTSLPSTRGGSGLDIETKKPNVGLDVDAPDFNTTKDKFQTEMSGPDVEVPSGNFKGPKANIHGPSADLNAPSRKKPRGNCLSCAGDADKDEPYRRGERNAQFDFDGPDLDGSLEMTNPALSKPDTGIGGRAVGPEFDLDTPDIDGSSPKPNIGLKSPGFDVPKAGGSGEINIKGPDLSYEKPKISEPTLGKTEKGIDIQGPDFDMNTTDADASANIPDIGFNSPEFDVSKPGGSGKIGSLGLDANAPDFNTAKGKLQTEMSGPDVDVPSGNIRGPKANIHGPSADLNAPSRKKPRGNCLSCAGDADKDEPYRKAKGNAKFDLDGPDLDGSLEMKEPRMRGPNADIGGRATGPELQMNAPDVDISSKEPNVGLKSPEVDAPSFGTSGKIDINGPEFSYEKPKISGPSFGKTEDDRIDIEKPSFGVHTPDIETSTKRPNIGFKSPGFGVPKSEGTGEIEMHGPDFSYGKPKISGPSIDHRDKDIDIRGPDLDIDTQQGRGDFDISKPDISVPSIDGDISWPSTCGGDLDVEANLPDVDISKRKPRFGLDTNRPDMDIPGVDNNLEFVEPRVSIPSIEKEGKSIPSFPSEDASLSVGTPDTDISAKKPSIELDMNGLEEDQTGDVDLELNRPDLDVTRNPTFGVDMKGLDVGKSGPDFTFPATEKREGSFEPPEIKAPRGNEFDAKLDWGINTSTPKGHEVHNQLKGFPHGDIELETSPVESDISVVNTYDNIELQSTPQSFPSAAYDQPRSLQRYDEIRPEMELRLLSPKDTDQSQQNFTFGIPDTSPGMAKDSWKPGSMTLVKVEENVTVCSASVEEDEPPSSNNRKLTLDREIKQKIEVIFPEEEGTNQPSNLNKKLSTRSSSSTSSSSDADGDKEKKPKRKKKSRLLKAFRKSSSSSASSKDGDTPLKQKEKERKQSKSSSSSDEEDVERKKRPSKGDALPVKIIEEKKIRISSTSSSSDEAPSVVQKKDLPKRKTSKSSSSSSDNESHIDEKKMEHKTFPSVKDEKKQPEEPVPSFNTLQEDVPMVASHSVKPMDPHLSFVVEKPDEEMKRKERKSSTSSSSDEESKSPVVYKVEYNTYQQQYLIEPESKLDQPPEVVLHSVKPKDPDFSFIPETQTKERKSSTSSSSSSDGEAANGDKDAEETDLHDPQMVEFTLLPQKHFGSYDISQLDDPQKAIEQAPPERKSSTSSSSSEEEKEAPKRKSSTSSSSSEEDKDFSPTLDITVDRYETVHHVITPNFPSTEQERKSSDMQESPFVVVSRSIKRPDIWNTTTEKHDEPHVFLSSTEIQFSEPPTDVSYHLEYPSNLAEVEENNDTHVQEEGIVPVFKSRSVDHRMSEVSALIDSPDEDRAANQDTRTSPTWDIQAHTFETVYHVTIPDIPARDEDSQEIEEFSPTIVSRSVKRTAPVITSGDDDLEEEPQFFTSTTEVQFSEPNNNFELEYPERDNVFTTDKRDVPMTDDEWIRRHTVERKTPDISALQASFDHPEENSRQSSVDHDMSEVSALIDSPDEDRAANQDTRTSPTWDIQAHTFETVYYVTNPDIPARNEDSQEIEEFSPTVVTRSVKRTAPAITSGDDDLEEEPQFFTSTTEVQFSEPSNDFQLEYPERDNVLTTDKRDVPITDEEWIRRHTVERETPDISALQASFDHPEEKSQQSADASIKIGDEQKSPREKSPKDAVRRGSNSRLWDLMQGYLIEEPIFDDGDTNSEVQPVDGKKEEEYKVEIAKPVPKVESSVFQLNQQSTETVPEVTSHPSKFVTYTSLVDDKEPSTEVTTSITKVKSSIAEVTPKATKFDPVSFQVDVGDKKPASKDRETSSWRKQVSVPVDVDDKDDDPWMRHYSKGLQRGFSYQPASTKPPESETSFSQSRSLSLSKVPHVRGIKSSAEKDRERQKYSIESRTRTEPTAYRGTTERRPLLRELEAVPRVRTNESVFSIREDKTQSPMSQTRTTGEESPRERSGIGPSVKNLRSLWDK